MVNERAEQRVEKAGLRVGTWNVSSINVRGQQTQRQQALLEDCETKGVQLLGLTDTRRKGSGCEVWTSDRDKRKWSFHYSGVSSGRAAAGVGFVVSPKLSEDVVLFKPINERLCYLQVRIGRKVETFVLAYAPTKELQYPGFLTSLDSVYMSLKDRSKAILLGDLNGQVGNNRDVWGEVLGPHGVPGTSSNGVKLLTFLSERGLCVMNTYFKNRDSRKYTWERPNVVTRGAKRSLIDLFVSSTNCRCLWTNVRSYKTTRYNSDHRLVVASLRTSFTPPTRRQRPRRISRIRHEQLKFPETEERFQEGMEEAFRRQADVPAETVEEDWRRFRSSLLSTCAEACGTSTKVIGTRRSHTQWWSVGVKEAVMSKRVARRRLAQKPYNPAVLTAYKVAKRLEQKILRQAKSLSKKKFGQFLENSWQMSKSNYWKVIRRLRSRRNDTSHSIKSKEGAALDNQSDILRRWAEYFKNLLNPTVHTEQWSPPKDFRRSPTDRDEQLNEELPNLEELNDALQKVKEGRAAGVDEIRPEMVKTMGTNGVAWLLQIFRNIWKSGRCPSDWSTAALVPLYKKGDIADCNNYRGISLLSLPSKLFATVLLRRCQKLAEHVLSEEQTGFRRGRGTTDAIFTLRIALEKRWEFNQPVHLAFIDLEKAYDRVPRDVLWQVLPCYGIKGTLLRSVMSLYDNTSGVVRTSFGLSEKFPQTVGVRQGCTLSPYLFLIYMDAIMRKCRPTMREGIGRLEVRRLLYADDIVLLEESRETLQGTIDEVSSACEQSGMRVSTSKTKVMEVSRDPSILSLTVRGEPLEQVEHFSYLGTMISQNGSPDLDVSKRLKTARAVLSTLYDTVIREAELSLPAKAAIFNQVFTPTLLYGHESLTLNNERRARLKACEMSFIRTALGVSLREETRNSDLRDRFGSRAPLLYRLEQSQLKWYGHVLRMAEDRLPKRTLEAKMVGKRPVGKPRKRWLSSICELLKRLGVSEGQARVMAQDRRQWKKLIEELPHRTLGKGESG